jgi:thioredoxin 2
VRNLPAGISRRKPDKLFQLFRDIAVATIKECWRVEGVPMIRVCQSCGQKNRIPAQHLSDEGRCGKCKTAIPPVAEPLDVDAAEFDEIVTNSSVPVLIDFWAAWCGPCRMAAPEVKTAASQMAGRAIVLKVDTEKAPALAQRYNVMSIPNFVVLKNGRIIHQQPGLVDHRQMITWLNQAA